MDGTAGKTVQNILEHVYFYIYNAAVGSQLCFLHYEGWAKKIILVLMLLEKVSHKNEGT